LTVTGSIFDKNLGGRGAGIYLYSNHSTISNTVFSDNIGFDGGGIYLRSGTAHVNNSTFSNNSSGNGNGGGISAIGNLTVSNSVFSGNLGIMGGGIAAYGNLSMTNSTLSGNFAWVGGAIYSRSALTLTNSTLSGNSALGGGGLWIDAGTLAWSNTIIAHSAKGIDCANEGTMTTNINNLAEDGSCQAMFNGDPLLGPLQANGGPTWTHALLEGSPAIDAGNNAVCPASDQRGTPRSLDGDGDGHYICDIGAYEYGIVPTVIADLALVKTAAPNPVTVHHALTYTVVVYNAGPNGANGVILNDTLPLTATLIKASTNQGTCNEAGGLLSCHLGEIESSEMVTVTIEVLPLKFGILVNHAWITATTADLHPQNNEVINETIIEPLRFYLALILRR
jgi:uncharacterized repeat protein (TIGR01451 family)